VVQNLTEKVGIKDAMSQLAQKASYTESGVCVIREPAIDVAESRKGGRGSEDSGVDPRYQRTPINEQLLLFTIHFSYPS
jgi:hypothetical protein